MKSSPFIKNYNTNNSRMQQYRNKKSISMNSMILGRQGAFIQQRVHRIESSYTPKSFKKKQSFKTIYNTYRQPKISTSFCKSSSTRRQRTVPKSKSTNFILQKERQTPAYRKITRIVPKKQAQFQKNTYKWRMNTHFPVLKVQLLDSKEIKLYKDNQSYQELQLQISNPEEIQFTLSQIEEFNLLNSVYILNEVLVSFQRLFNRFGFFQPTLNMIFITNEFKCKVWLNQNIWENSPSILSSTLKRHYRVQEFYKKIINIFSKFFQNKFQRQKSEAKRNAKLIQKLIYQLQNKKDFVQGLKCINEFLHIYSLKLNNRYILPSLCSQIRSRIHSNLSQNTALRSSIEKQLSKRNKLCVKDSAHIKTLKNSINPFNGIKQSNCKTITKNSQYFRSNELDFKRKSQVSICSKQTIVQKKSRFSMHQYNLFGKGSKLEQFKSNLPQFTNQDFEQNEQEQYTIQSPLQQQDGAKPIFFKLNKVNDEQEEQEFIRNQIEKKVREQNGWLQSTNLFLENDEFVKSFQGSEPSIKMRDRGRSLTKLNKIKKSISNSIMEGSIS